jgi:tetratricopeptide (TPR) repeat protein
MRARIAPIALSVLVAAACWGCNRTPAPGPDAGLAAPLASAAPLPDGVTATQAAAPTELSNAAAFQEKAPRAQVARDLPVPIALTGSDGSGLVLQKLSARAVLEGPLAFTELHLTFHNPEDRRREGRFSITLPTGAAVSRFAMKNAGGWMEGEVVERRKAQQVYEDFLHRRQDPALLEQDAGNTFAARVFPIEPNADKELILSFSQELVDPRASYALPLAGLPQLGELSIRVYLRAGDAAGPQVAAGSLGAKVGNVQVVEVEQRNFQPAVDFLVHPAFLKSPWTGLRNGNLALARVQLDSQAAAQGFERLVVLFDTSASQAPGFSKRIERLTELLRFAAARGAHEVAVVAFDQTTEVIFRGAPAGWGPAQVQKLLTRAALGASDLGSALDAVPALLQGGKGAARVVLVGDGVVTAGDDELDGLRKRVAALGAAGVVRLDSVATMAARDANVLEAVTRGGLASDGVAVGAFDSAEDLEPLGLAVWKAIDVQVPGAAWVWPNNIEGLQPGQARLVYADLPDGKPFEIQLSGGVQQTVKPNVTTAAQPLLERAWIGARIGLLTARSAEGDPDLRAAFEKQAIDLSVKHRVLSPGTALLVLETEYDYERYGIDRKALAEILTVSPEGAAVLSPRTDSFAALQMANSTGDKTAETAEKEEGAFGGGGDEAKRAEPADDRAAAGAAAADQPMPSEAPAAPAPEAAAPMAKSVPSVSRLFAEEAMPEPPGAGDIGNAMGFRGVGQGGGGGGLADQLGTVPSGGAGRIGIGSGSAGFGSRGDGRAMAERRRVAVRRDVEQNGVLAILGDEDRNDGEGLAEIRAALKNNPALSGRLLKISTDLREKRTAAALAEAWKWRTEDPGDVLALAALGRALLASGQPQQAARAYGAIVDLFPSRADLRRFAGNLLEGLGKDGSVLALDTYRKALKQRPDHPSVFVMAGWALARAGQYGEAVDLLIKGVGEHRREGNFPEIERILKEQAGLIAAAWLAQEPKRDAEIRQRLSQNGIQVPTVPSLRFLLTWETDANDVDFHLFDAKNGHASFREKQMPSGGELYADVTTGYGPECFAVESPKAFPYKLFANYYSRGPMGWGMGRVLIVRHDGKGGLRFEDRPFIIQNDHAWVELGEVGR